MQSITAIKTVFITAGLIQVSLSSSTPTTNDQIEKGANAVEGVCIGPHCDRWNRGRGSRREGDDWWVPENRRRSGRWDDGRWERRRWNEDWNVRRDNNDDGWRKWEGREPRRDWNEREDGKGREEGRERDFGKGREDGRERDWIGREEGKGKEPEESKGRQREDGKGKEPEEGKRREREDEGKMREDHSEKIPDHGHMPMPMPKIPDQDFVPEHGKTPERERPMKEGKEAIEPPTVITQMPEKEYLPTFTMPMKTETPVMTYPIVTATASLIPTKQPEHGKEKEKEKEKTMSASRTGEKGKHSTMTKEEEEEKSTVIVTKPKYTTTVSKYETDKGKRSAQSNNAMDTSASITSIFVMISLMIVGLAFTA